MNLLARRASRLILASLLCPLIQTDVGSLSLSRRNSKYLKSPVYTHIHMHEGAHTGTDAAGYPGNEVMTYDDGRSGRKVLSKQEKRQNLRKQNRQKSKGENEFNLVTNAETSTIDTLTSIPMMTIQRITTTTTTNMSPNVTMKTTTEDFDAMLRSVLDFYRAEATTETTETRHYMNERRSISDYEEDYEDDEYVEMEDRRLNDRTMPRIEKHSRKSDGKSNMEEERKEWRKLKRLESRGKAENDRAVSEPNKRVRVNKRKIVAEKMQKINARREMRKNKRKPGPEPNAIDYTVSAKPGDRSQVRKIKRKEERNKNKTGLRRQQNKFDKYFKHKDVDTHKHHTYRDQHNPGIQPTYTSKYNKRVDGGNVKLERKAQRQRKRQKSKDRGYEGRAFEHVVGTGSSQRGHEVSMFDLGVLRKQIFGENDTTKESAKTDRRANNGLLQITGTSAFDSFFGSFSTAVQNVFTVTLVAFSIALWVSVFVFWFNGAEERRDPQQYHYDYIQGSRPDRPHSTGLRSRVARVMEYISPESLERLIENIKPALSRLAFKPSLKRMGTDAIDGVGTFGNIATALILGTAGTLSEKMSGGVGAVSDIVGNKKIQDCLLQTVCYYSAAHGQTKEGKTGVKRMLEVFGLDNEFEGRKKSGKKDKKKRKTKKKQNAVDYYSANNDNSIDSDNFDDDDTLDTGDCEVFECNVVSLGHTAYSLYDRVSQLSDRIRGS